MTPLLTHGLVFFCLAPHTMFRQAIERLPCFDPYDDVAAAFSWR